ncbi:helix-turn-helix domain-containing protein [Mycetocola miduiensis]|uniref:Transcriptional regulator, AraC family n=1 Tax=Mycetocola miduiensis TaxID=995034 RepID=A0A1I5A623_9MICO|nr:AraC family transcriptional regulator [Mycetocola miduiensis]SFN57856.1 transcriptional regulator, AraC family [Mycetocola miduiensis]
MEYLQREPSGVLAGVVRSLWLVRGQAQQSLERIFPMPFVHLIVNLSGPYRATDPLSGVTAEPLTAVFCSGLQRHFTLSENPSALFNLGAVLEPDAVGRLGLDPAEITGRVVNVESVLPDVAGFRQTTLAAADLDPAAGPGSGDDLLDALHAALVLSLRDDAPDLVVRRAVAVISADPSRSVASVAEECNLSHKSLIGRFRRATGVTPKFYATVVRFHRLIDELPLGDDVPWAELAAATGYYDQSHVIRTFKTFTGFTPQDYYRIARTHGRESTRFVPVG